MSNATVRERSAVGARRLGYTIAVVVNAAMLYAVNAWPGWQAVPFLTADTVTVLPLVNASVVVSLVANAVYVVHDPAWARALGDLATSAVGLLALVRMWQVFPFDFGDATVDWELVTRWVLGIGIAGSAIAIVVALVSLVRALANTAPGPAPRSRRARVAVSVHDPSSGACSDTHRTQEGAPKPGPAGTNDGASLIRS